MPLIIPTLALLGAAAPNLSSVAPSQIGAHITDRWVLAGDRILAMEGNEAYLMESRTGEVLRVLRGHGEPLETVAIHPRGARALTSSFVIENETFTPSRDTSVRLWDLKTGRQILRLENAAFGRYSAKGDRFLTVAKRAAGRPTLPSIGDGVIRVYRAGDAREICAASVPDFNFRSGRAQFARGDAVVVALTFNDLRVFDSRDGRLLFTLAVEGERPVGIDISRSGDKVLAYTSNGCTVWSLKTGALLGRISEPAREAANDNGPPSAVFCRDERRVAVIVRGVATIFRIEGGVYERALPTSGSVTRLVRSPDSDLLLVEWSVAPYDSNGAGVTLFGIGSRASRVTVPYERGAVTSLLGFAAGKDEFATASGGVQGVRFYSARTGRLLRSLARDPKTVDGRSVLLR